MAENNVMKRLLMQLVAAATIPMLCSCETIRATPLPAGIARIHVVNNPRVIVEGFEVHLKQVLSERGIAIQSTQMPPADATSYVLTYTAKQGWDLAPFLNHVDISITKAGRSIADATYRHAGGLSLAKWGSVEAKMMPVYDKLLANYPLVPRFGR
jgi:hypothetical protein